MSLATPSNSGIGSAIINEQIGHPNVEQINAAAEVKECAEDVQEANVVSRVPLVVVTS